MLPGANGRAKGACKRHEKLGLTEVIQPVKPLSCISEAESLRKKLFFLQPAKSVPHSSRRKIGLVYDIPLRFKISRHKDFVDQLG